MNGAKARFRLPDHRLHLNSIGNIGGQHQHFRAELL